MGAMASQITSLNGLFWRRSKKISKLRLTGLWTGNSSGNGEFPAQMASNAENDSIWRQHVPLNYFAGIGETYDCPTAKEVILYCITCQQIFVNFQ